MGSAEAGFRPDIEGLRGLAILLVVAYHAHVPGFTGGYIGVDVFFVLSGYLITGLLIAEIQATGRVDFPGFYARRVRRLLPAAVTVVIATLLLGRIIYPPSDHPGLANSGLATSLYISNVYFARSATDYLAEADGHPLLHTWSLAVEEQFYLFWPAIVLVGLVGLRSGVRPGRLAATMVAIAASSYVLCIWLTARSQPWAFFMLPTRAWEFAIGALARMVPQAWLSGSRALFAVSWTGLLAILAAGLGFGSQTVFPGAVALVPVAGTGLLVAAGAVNCNAGPLALLANRPIQWIGRMSYSWYLWHWPILTFAQAFPPLRGTVTAVALGGMSLGLAAMTHALIENPIRFSPALRARPRHSLAVGAALTLAGAGASVLIGIVGARAAGAPGQVVYREARDLPAIYADGCHLSLAETRLGPCEYGDTSASSAMVLFGDSHAAQWFPALEAVARERRMKLVSLTKSACPAAAVRLANKQLGRQYTECARWREAALERIVALQPEVVVIANYGGYIALPGDRDRWTTSAEEWRSGLQQTVAALDSADIRTVLLADTPYPAINVPSCLARAAWVPSLPRDRCEFSRLSGSMAVAHATDAHVAAAVPSAEAVNLTDAICAREPCPAEVGGMVLYRDAHHLTTRFAASLAGLLAGHLLPGPAELVR